jgi:Hg(II)-responsive transcriptional regulator
MKSETMTIGEVAARARVNVQTLRYYERRGILKEPARSASGYRGYRSEAVQIVRFIKRAQDLGFTLDEIQDLLRLRDSRSTSCATVRASAEAKIEDIDAKISALRAMKRALTVLVASCGQSEEKRDCPIIEALDDVGRERRRS